MNFKPIFLKTFSKTAFFFKLTNFFLEIDTNHTAKDLQNVLLPELRQAEFGFNKKKLLFTYADYLGMRRLDSLS